MLGIINKITTMAEINFQPVFDYFDQKEVNILDAVKIMIQEEVRPLRTDVANLAGQVQDFHDEMAVMGFRTTRLEEWATPVGKKVKIPLEL